MGGPPAARDLGLVQPGARRTEVFRVVNGGRRTLNILELRPECSCVAAQAARTRLGPGERTEIVLTLDPPAQDGPLSKSLEVVTDADAGAGAAASTRLVLTAVVQARLHLSANQVTFQDLPRDGGGLAEVRVEDRSGQPVQVTGISTSAPAYLSVQPSGPGPGVLLQLRLDAARIPPGQSQGQDWVRIETADPDQPELRIQVLWTAQPSPKEGRKP